MTQPLPNDRPGGYRFADLTLDLGRRELTRDGKGIELGKLTFALLVALVEASPSALTHEEIIERVWKGRATSPETVTQRIKLLRDALSDDAANPRYIALLRGQGYRLMPACVPLPRLSPEVRTSASPAAPTFRLFRRFAPGRTGIALGVLLALAALSTALLRGESGRTDPTESSPAERRSIESPSTAEAAAYALYREALVDTDGRRMPLENDRNRLQLLDRAISLNPNLAAAYEARAWIYVWNFAYSEAGSSQEEVERRADYEGLALADAGRALELDPSLPGPWIVRGVLSLERWRWPEAEAAFERALDLGPNDPQVLLQYAFFATYAGDFDKALALARRRLAIDPESVESNNGLGFIAIVAQDHETAIARYVEVQRLAPGIWFHYATAAIAFMEAGDKVGAERAVRMADQLRGPEDMAVFLTNSARVYRWLGLPDDSGRAFSTFEDWTKENVVGAGDWALAYQGIGDYERMYQTLQQAIAKVEANEPDSHQALIFIAANVANDPVLDEPRFRELRARLLPGGSLGDLKRPQIESATQP